MLYGCRPGLARLSDRYSIPVPSWIHQTLIILGYPAYAKVSTGFFVQMGSQTP